MNNNMNNSCNNNMNHSYNNQMMNMQGNMQSRRQMPMRNAYNMNMQGSNTNMPDKSCFNKKEVCMNVYELGFVMTELLLYLDTHPDDLEAIEYYNKMKEKYKKAVKIYEDKIGPLTFTSVDCDNYWTWVATPMPWEMEGC